MTRCWTSVSTINVGVGGRRLTAAQRQKLDVARALLKRADFIIFNRPLAALDQRSQDLVTKNVLEELNRDGRNPAILWVLPNPHLANLFEHIIVFHGGELVAGWNARDFGEGKRYFHTVIGLMGQAVR